MQVSKGRVRKSAGLTTRAGKGRGRRTLLKSKPVKGIKNPPTPFTGDKVYYRVSHLGTVHGYVAAKYYLPYLPNNYDIFC